MCFFRSRLADFHTHCQMSEEFISTCPNDDYQACLTAYTGLIGKTDGHTVRQTHNELKSETDRKIGWCLTEMMLDFSSMSLMVIFLFPSKGRTWLLTTRTRITRTSPSRRGVAAGTAGTRRKSVRSSCGTSEKTPACVRTQSYPHFTPHHRPGLGVHQCGL